MENQVSSGNVLTWGILALAFCCCPVLGVIFACVAKKKARAFANANGQVFGAAKVGSIFGKIAFPISIVMQVVWVIYIIVVAAAVAFAF